MLAAVASQSPVTALFVHGVGREQSGFSVNARRNLRATLTARGRAFYALEALWAPIADRYEDAFLAAAQHLGSDGNAAQQLVVGTLADALMWQSTPALRDEVFALLDAQMTRLHVAPTVFAHSLGVVVFSDWLRARPDARIARLIAMGNNLALFNMGKPFECPAQLAPKGVWTTLWSPSDMLGFAANAQRGFTQVRDVKVQVGGWFDRFTGLSHCAFWDDRRLWSRTIPKLLE